MDPVTRLLDDLQRLLHALVAGSLALATGLLAAPLMRRANVHWTWTIAALPALLLARLLDGSLVLAAAIALACALARGRSLHRRDLDAGADLARRAGARRALPVAAVARRLRERPSGSRLRLGVDGGGRSVSVPFGPGALGHMLVVGATGSGKTVTQTLIAMRAIEAGLAAIVLDPKGDAQMTAQLAAAAARAGRPFLRWSTCGPTVYNPYACGGQSEIADRVLAGERFTEPHYLRQAQRYMGHLVRALTATRREVSLAAIVALLEPKRLEALLRELPDERQASAGHDYLDSLSSRQLRDLSGVRDRVAVLAESDVGPWLDPGSAAGPLLELGNALDARAVVCFALESDSRPLISRMLAAAILADLQSAVAARQRRPGGALVVIDEFSALGAEQVVGLFGRARSAGFVLLLGTQELSDLKLEGRERVLEQVLGNLSLIVAHRQVVPESIDLLARLGGARGSWRTSWGSDGRATRTRVREPLLTPECLRTLPPGSAAVIALGEETGARVTRIEAPGSLPA
jgi:conjugal transfer pilus assembly protein TraD